MGATDFAVSIKTTKRADAAYRQIVEEAVYDYGHHPYNGTISTTDGYVSVPESFGSVSEVRGYINKHIQDYHKWSSCGHIAYNGTHYFFGLAAE